jgi:hypothetical protein
MTQASARIKAVLAVLAVFILTLAAIGAFATSPLGDWERRVLKRAFIEYGLMIAIPLLILLGTHKKRVAYGVSFQNIKYHLDIALTCFIPYSVRHALSFAVNLGHEGWDTLVSAGLAVGLLFALGRLLKDKPSAGNVAIAGLFLFCLPAISLPSNWTIDKAVATLIFYVVFLGPGEEFLFRGYIQSRLNEAFDRPYRFFGVDWGWGVIIASLLFGLFHVLNLPSLFAGNLDLRWLFGFETFFGGLVLGFVREKTGSIVAPALLHGLPQGIAYAFLGW